MKKSESQLTLVFHCHSLPGMECDGTTKVRLGIQQGDSVIDDVPADSEEVIFTFLLCVLLDGQTAPIDFRGPFVKGKVGERFVYLVWGERDGENWITLRRAKFYLRYIDRERLLSALDSGSPIALRMKMTDAKGTPLTASIGVQSFQFLP